MTKPAAVIEAEDELEDAIEEWTQEEIDDAIASAEERVRAAEAANAALVDAALRDRLSMEIGQCRNELTELKSNLTVLQAAIPERLAEMETRLTTLLQTMAAPPAPPPSPPPALPDPAIPDPESPDKTPPSESTPGAPKAPQRRFR